MQRETIFKERIRPFLEALPNSWIEKIQQRAIRGTPDFLCCIAGRFVAIELKRDRRQKPDKLQAFKLAKIKRASGITVVVHPENWEKVPQAPRG